MVPLQAVGVLSSAYPSGWLIGRVGARPVLGIMAVFPLLMCGASWLISEERLLPHLAACTEAEPLQPPGATWMPLNIVGTGSHELLNHRCA